MTTPANDETKKEEKTTSTSGSQPVKTDDTVAPKKRKRKRKPRKTTTPATEVTGSKESEKEEKTPTTSHKATTPAVHHTRKKAEGATPKDKKEEHKVTTPHKKEETKEETKRPNLDIKSDAHMLPGIDNIHEYIASKKAAAPHAHEKKEGTYSFVTPDGTDLLQLPGLYAIVPHSKGDHKLVYLQGNAPEGLGEDPRKRIPGKMYVKNGRDIYMVTLIMKEHPSLKDSHGESYDVWLIENEQQLTDQITAIKQGIGGGENFGEIMFLSDIDTKATSGVETIVPADTLPQPEEENNQVVLEEIQEESNEEEVIAEQVDASAKEVDTEASLPSESSEESNEETTDKTSGTDLLNSIENTIDIDIPEEDLAMIDLTLPTDENLTAPDTIEIDGYSAGTEQTPEIETEVAQNNEQVTLDMDLPEEIVAEDVQEAPEQNDEDLPTNTQEEVQQEKEEITLDMNQEEAAIENNDEQEEATPHFMSAESSLPISTIDLSNSEQEPIGSLFGSAETKPAPESTPVVEESSTGGMFRDPVQTTKDTSLVSDEEPIETINTETAATPPLEEIAPPSEPLFSSQSAQHTMPGITPSPDETTDTETETGSIEESDPSSVNLDDLSIDSPEETSIDLDNLPASSEPTEATSALQANCTQTTTTPVKKASFPFHIIIRVVLFLLISGALVLVRKVMFPTIQGIKPVDTPSSETGQVIDDTPQPTDGETIPTTDIPTPEDTTPPGEDTPPALIDDTPPVPASLTLNELTEKLKVQQTDARKVLNIAKLLENKQAIKFSLAAMLKAGNVLERIDTETTITAQDVLQESQKIDRYLQEANKLIE